MRLIYSLPKLGDTLSHDSPLLKIIRLAVPAFILISAVTVFWGVKAHISQYLSYYPTWIQYPSFTIGFLLFSLAPDVLNSVLIAYVARTILKRKFDHLSIILMVFCTLLSIGLTFYSYQMSKFSAIEAANEASGEAEIVDLAPIDQKLEKDLQRITDDYNSEKQTIESNYAALIETENQAIASWEKKRNDGNTHWIDRQQDRRRKAIATLLEKQKSDLEALRSRKQAKEDKASEQHQKDRTKAESDNTAKENQHNDFAAIFADKLSWLSGNAVFVVLILTCIREILYNRNGVEIKPIFGQFDFQPSPILESLALPFVAVGRHIINRVRSAYEALPELKRRPDFEPVVDYSNYQQKVNTPNGNPQQAQGNPTPSAKQTAQPDDRDYRNFKRFATGITVAKCLENYEYWTSQDQSKPEVQKQVKFWRDKVVALTGQQPEDVETVESPDDDFWKDLMTDIEIDDLLQDNGFSKNQASTAQAIAENPSQVFTNPQRITIRGFQPHKVGEKPLHYNASSISNATINNAEAQKPKMGVKNCLHCGDEFTPKVNWQKFCKKEHQLAYHAEKHGKRFDPAEYHAKKKRKKK